MIRLKQQRGAALIFALVFLLMLTLIGVTASKVTSLEERMAGNTRERDLALEAAEAALRDAQQRLAAPDAAMPTEGGPFRALATPVNAMNANDIAFWNAYNWNAALAVRTIMGQVAAQPVFVLERWGNTNRFRVTARGVGGTTESTVILQAEFQCTGAGVANECP